MEMLNAMNCAVIAFFANKYICVYLAAWALEGRKGQIQEAGKPPAKSRGLEGPKLLVPRKFKLSNTTKIENIL